MKQWLAIGICVISILFNGCCAKSNNVSDSAVSLPMIQDSFDSPTALATSVSTSESGKLNVNITDHSYVSNPQEAGNELDETQFCPPSSDKLVSSWNRRLPKICIDPGHYYGVNTVTGEKSYGYVEGDFTLQVALNLQRILLEKYGIESFLTRETGTIDLHGYSDYELDSMYLELRGAVAKEQDCDFFLSIHTNANLPNANDYPPLLQPKQITKTIVLANELCCQDETWIAVANAIGENVSTVNVEEGIAEERPFIKAEAGNIPDWSDWWNDSLTQPGAVLRRLGEHGDYYGVLRGANKQGIPGIIVEHGFHSVPEMRYAASYGDLAMRWAEADADGIAEGLGISPKN